MFQILMNFVYRYYIHRQDYTKRMRIILPVGIDEFIRLG